MRNEGAKKSGHRCFKICAIDPITWARPIMESTKRAEIKVFDYDHGLRRKAVRRYIWLEEYDYVVILQRKRNVYFWVTAYYVDSKGGGVDLNRRYKKRL
jgi:hypothetical protein